MAQHTPSTSDLATLIKAVHGIRYQVKDVARAATFYTQHLGFTLKHQQLPAFANVALGNVDLLLSGPGASGSRALPDGRAQEPGGWNRVVLRVADLPACGDGLQHARDQPLLQVHIAKAGLAGRNQRPLVQLGPEVPRVRIDHDVAKVVARAEP